MIGRIILVLCILAQAIYILIVLYKMQRNCEVLPLVLYIIAALFFMLAGYGVIQFFVDAFINSKNDKP